MTPRSPLSVIESMWNWLISTASSNEFTLFVLASLCMSFMVLFLCVIAEIVGIR